MPDREVKKIDSQPNSKRLIAPVVGGLLIDCVDLATFGPIGLFLGFVLGALISLYITSSYQISRETRHLIALISGVYCTIPFTEFIPAATIAALIFSFNNKALAASPNAAEQKEKLIESIRVKGELPSLYLSALMLLFVVLVLAGINVFFIVLGVCFSVGFLIVKQNHLLGNTMRVSGNNFPEVFGVVESAAKRLSMAPPDVYVLQNPTINAFAMGFLGRKSVVLHSKTVECMTDEELLFILGHEFSHIRFGHTFWTTLTNSSNLLTIPVFSDIIRLIFLFWSRKAEYTCDRGGLIASRNGKASIAALIKLSVGEKLFGQVNMEGIFEQKKDIDDGITTHVSEMFATHPYLIKRIFSLQEFFQGGLYNQTTQTGH